MFEEYGDLLTPEECIEILQVGKNQVYSLLISGEIKAFKIGARKWKIPKESLILYIRKKANLI